MISYKKLEETETTLARTLILWFQEDDLVPQPVAPSDYYLRNLLVRDDFHMLVAMDGDKVVGGLTAFELPMYKEEVNEIFLYEIGVDETYRKRNIATELIECLKKIAAKRGIPEMYVGTEMNNVPARKLYQKTGGSFGSIAWYVYKLEKKAH
ncbi:hypothetical protein CNR22_22385 [Sphingobacteriaceae bacterium]|nr:hypothetical protein CNR22_22385 [Sphingobacteriaceae bacterium]